MKTYAMDIETGQETTEEDRNIIEDVNITTKMNMSQMATEQQVNTKEDEELNTEETPTHGYNLRKRPTRHAEKVSLTQMGHITGVEQPQELEAIW